MKRVHESAKGHSKNRAVSQARNWGKSTSNPQLEDIDARLKALWELETCVSRARGFMMALGDRYYNFVFNHTNEGDRALLEANAMVGISVEVLDRLRAAVITAWLVFNSLQPTRGN